MAAAVALRVASSQVEFSYTAPTRPRGDHLYAVEPAQQQGPTRKPQYRWEVSAVDGRLVRVWS
jgi:hypothetical protein